MARRRSRRTRRLHQRAGRRRRRRAAPARHRRRAGSDRFAARIARARASPRAAGAAPRDAGALLRARAATLGAAAPLCYDAPLHVVRGDGACLIDADGRRYLDAYNNVAGRRPRPPGASRARSPPRLATLNTNTRYLHEAIVELAERLLATMPAGLDTVLFVNSGSEANDLALRIARVATGGRGAIVTAFAYHGITDGDVALSPESWQHGAAPPDVALVDPAAARRATRTSRCRGRATRHVAPRSRRSRAGVGRHRRRRRRSSATACSRPAPTGSRAPPRDARARRPLRRRRGAGRLRPHRRGAVERRRRRRRAGRDHARQADGQRVPGRRA